MYYGGREVYIGFYIGHIRDVRLYLPGLTTTLQRYGYGGRDQRYPFPPVSTTVVLSLTTVAANEDGRAGSPRHLTTLPVDDDVGLKYVPLYSRRKSTV